MGLDKKANPTMCVSCKKISDAKEEICDECGGVEFVPYEGKIESQNKLDLLLKRANELGVKTNKKDRESLKKMESLVAKAEKEAEKKAEKEAKDEVEEDLTPENTLKEEEDGEEEKK